MRVLFAWEMGANPGHAGKLVEVARVLARKRGKNKGEPYFVFQNPAILYPWVKDVECELFQAPHLQGSITQRSPVLIYPDEYRSRGYDDAGVLAGLIHSWRSLYKQIKPHVIVAHSAPTALLAARGMRVKTVAIGSGFDVPPAISPIPLMQYWERVDPAVVLGHEEHILRNVNKALEELELPEVENLCDAFSADRSCVTGFEEMDHYPERGEGTEESLSYVGPFYSTDTGEELSWDGGAKTRILAYLRPDVPSFMVCMEALKAATPEYDCIVSAPGIPDELRQRFEKDNVRIVSGPVRLDKLLKKCDLGISHGNNAIASAFATAGVPQLLVPNNVEELMLARALGRAKVARGVVGQFTAGDVLELMALLLGKESFKEDAKALASKYKSFKPEQVAASIADEIVKLGRK